MAISVSSSGSAAGRQPRLALSITLEQTLPGLPSVTGIAAVIGAVTRIFAIASQLHAEPGPLDIPEAHRGEVSALAVVQNQGDPLIISASRSDGTIRSWRLNGKPGPLDMPEAHHAGLSSLAVVEHQGEPLIIGGGDFDGAILSWRLNGKPGPLDMPEAHDGAGVSALAVVEHQGEPLIISAGFSDRTIRSWRLDGKPSPLGIPDVHRDGVSALAVVEHQGEPLIISGGRSDGAIRSWRFSGEPLSASSAIRGPAWMSFDTRAAAQLEVRQLSLASPLELVLHLPVAIAMAPPVLGFVLYAIKRLWSYDIEIRSYREQRRVELLKAEQERERLEADNPPEAEADIRALRDDMPNGWEMTDGTLSDEDV